MYIEYNENLNVYIYNLIYTIPIVYYSLMNKKLLLWN